jgi:hypothetical protein
MRCLTYLLIKIHRKFTSAYLLCDKASLRKPPGRQTMKPTDLQKQPPFSASGNVDNCLNKVTTNSQILTFFKTCAADQRNPKSSWGKWTNRQNFNEQKATSPNKNQDQMLDEHFFTEITDANLYFFSLSNSQGQTSPDGLASWRKGNHLT